MTLYQEGISAKKKSEAGSEFRKCVGRAAALCQVKKSYLNSDI